MPFFKNAFAKSGYMSGIFPCVRAAFAWLLIVHSFANLGKLLR